MNINIDEIYNNRPRQGRPKKDKIKQDIGRPKKYTSDEEKKQAMREANKRYKDKNKEKLNEYSKQYYCENKENMKKLIYISKWKKRNNV